MNAGAVGSEMEFTIFLIVLVVSVLAFVGIIGAQHDEAVKSQANAKRIEAERQKKERDRLQYIQSLNERLLRDTLTSAAVSYTEIPGHLVSAEHCLDRAETEFEERAFDPYWDAIESALRALGEADCRFNAIRNYLDQSKKLIEKLDGQSVSFPVAQADVFRLKTSTSSVRGRLDDILRMAQTDIEFTSIYHLRRHNQILIAGFRNLAEAIYGIGNQISSAIDGLATQVAELEAGQTERHGKLVQQASWFADNMDQLASEAARQRDQLAGVQMAAATKQLAILDNIQRGRSPHSDERGPRII